MKPAPQARITSPRAGFVAIVGRPNSGKSTLLNALLGTELSIVTPKAQTTRERVLGLLTDPARGQLVFVDTPGIHRARAGGINEYMVGEATRALEGAHTIWWLLDPTSATEFERVVIETLLHAAPALKRGEVRLALILNKSDLPAASGSRLIPELRAALIREGVSEAILSEFEISALEGRGIEALLEQTWAAMPEHPPFYPDSDALSDRPMRFFAAEKIREQLFRQLGDELPYSSAVEITSYQEGQAGQEGQVGQAGHAGQARQASRRAQPPKRALDRIEARIIVERESQKAMVIGARGQKIKSIGTEARQSLERFSGRSIYLGLQVVVRPGWSKNREWLERLGYGTGERA